MRDEEMTRAAARVGSVLRGKYRIDRVLGIGGMAVVYAVTHRNRKRFAVKILHPELSTKESIRERFVREGYVANTIEHPNALAVLDDDTTEDGAPFVVMELLEGLTVEDLAAKNGRRLSVQVALAVAHELLDVLAAAHRHTIVHRDIKPANVFVLHDGTVKVLDFGIARLREVDVAQSQTGMLVGTPAFLPPEQARGKSSEIDARTDIWAVGATLFTLLTGEHVHAGESSAELVFVAASQPARSIAFVSDLPADVIEIVDRALSFAKEERWASAEALQAAIANTYRALFGSPISKEPTAQLMLTSAPLPEPQASAPVLSGFDSVPIPISVEASLVGSTSTLHTSAAPVAAPTRWPLVLGVGLGVAVLASVAMIGALFLLRPPAPMPAPSAAVATSPETSAPAAATSAPRPEPSEAPSAVAVAAPVAAPARSAPRPAPASPVARPASPAAAPSAPAPSPSAPAPSPPSLSAPASCKPPYELDAQGNKHWKPQCL